jgi:hypothetical protein
MCVGGGGGGGASPDQVALQKAQIAAQKQASDDALAEQKREFDATAAQNAQALADAKALTDKNQAAADLAAANTKTWETGRAANAARATQTVNDAFAQFTPEYYAKFTKNYTDHYNPQIDQQYAGASNNTVFGLARSGNLQSQTAADQIATNATENAQAHADINDRAIGATTGLRNNVEGAKANLMQVATSGATLGSPITPGSADAISANFNNTAQAISNLHNTAGDTVTTLNATPAYSSLGSLFGAAASGVGAAVNGNNTFNLAQAYQQGLANNPNGSSGRVQ